MDSRLTSQQYRKLAEGLLQNAIEASKDQKQDLIKEALRYLTHARLQEQHQSEPQDEHESHDEENRFRQIRQLIKQALETPTPRQFVEFLEFSTKFRRLSVWNAHMARIQRPGAHVIATGHEWRSAGRYVLPDAVPIMILWPFSPIRLVYELDDTGPPIKRDGLRDPFAVEGNFKSVLLSRLVSNLKKQSNFKITIEARREGHDRAGSAAAQGNSWNPQNQEIKKLAEENAFTGKVSTGGVPAFRITVNDRLETSQRFVTIAHELAHISCGHLGNCPSRNAQNGDESGWPDRQKFGKHEKEIEAEAAAFLIASRVGLIARSAAYLAAHVRHADIKQINMDLVVRAAARIERLANIHHGVMDFGSRPKQ
jgi:hypothetical protein